MAVRKVTKTRLITRTEKKVLSDRFYSYINAIDTLLDKNITPQTKVYLKRFKADLRKCSKHLGNF